MKSENLTTIDTGPLGSVITFDPSEIAGWSHGNSDRSIILYFRGGSHWNGQVRTQSRDCEGYKSPAAAADARYANIVSLLTEVLG